MALHHSTTAFTPAVVLLFLLLLLFLAPQTTATPQIAFPLNAQLPPVARVSQPFTFTFASTTFSSPDGPPSYTFAAPAPAWLALNSTTRTLTGTPTPADLGFTNFSLIATDPTGAAATMPATLVVLAADSTPPPPRAAGNITAQLLRAGTTLSGPSTLTLRPGTTFVLTLDAAAVFAPLPPDALFYATSADRSPLPSWISFEAKGLALVFEGLAPPALGLGEPQGFGMLVIVSRIAGFAEAEVGFEIMVGEHALGFEPVVRVVEVARDVEVEWELPPGFLLLDGLAVKKGAIVGVGAEVPEWLRFDADKLAFSGMAPAGVTEQQVVVNADDVHGDNATGIVIFRFQSLTLLVGQIGVLNATIGRPFVYAMGRTIIPNTHNIVARVDFDGSQPWLHFDTETLTLHGDVPSSDVSGTVDATLMVNSTTNSSSEIQTFEIRITEPASATGAVESRSGPAGTAATTSSVAGVDQGPVISDMSPLSKGAGIGIGIVSAILFLLLVGGLIWMWRKRRRDVNARSSDLGRPNRRHSRKQWISKPLFETGRSHRRFQRKYHHEDAPSMPPMPGHSDLEKGDFEHTAQDLPPQLESEIKGVGHSIRFSKYRQSSGSFLQPHDEAALQDMNRTSFGTDGLGIHAPHDSMKLPAQIARGVSDKSQAMQGSHRSSGLPMDRRLTGLGHGRVSHVSPCRRPGRLVRRRTRETMSWVSNSSHTMRRQIDSFLTPPRGVQITMETEPMNVHRAWIRLVSAEGDHPTQFTGLDQRPLAERRKSYIRNRASSGQPNPYFASMAVLSRESSHRKRMPLGNLSHNSRRLVKSATLTRSKSSSIGIQRATVGFQSIHAPTQASFKSGDDWESASEYSDDESEDEERKYHSRTVQEERECRRDKWSHRLGRDGRGEIMDSSHEREHHGTPKAGVVLAEEQRSRSWSRQALSPLPLAPRQRIASAVTDAGSIGGNAFL